MKKFNHLNIPQYWEQYWSKYPNGYSILESLIDWVSQVDDMVDNQNQTVDTVENFGDRLDEFLEVYDDNLSSTVEDTLSDWQESGFLDVVIDAALQTQMDVLEQETEQKLSDFNAQLAETEEKQIKDFMLNRSQLSHGSHKDKPLVTFTVDDAPRTDLDVLVPASEKYNVPFSIGVITERVGTGNAMTWQELRDLQETGRFELLSHSHEHISYGQATESQIDADLGLSLKLMRDNGLHVNGLIYPFNANSEESEKAVRKHVSYAFAKDGGVNLGDNTNRSMLNHRIRRTAMGSYFDDAVDTDLPTDSLEYYKYRVDEAIENNNWLVFVLHTAPMDETQIQFLDDLIEYIQLKGVDIANAREGFLQYGNIVELEDFSIDRKGKIISNQIQYRISPANSNDLDKDIRLYGNTIVDVTPITSSFARDNNFPSTQGGFLTTESYSTMYQYRKQTYETLNGAVFVRGVNSDYEWEDFVEVSSSAIEKSYYRKLIDISVDANSGAKFDIPEIPASQNYMVSVNARTGLPSGILYRSEISSQGVVQIVIYNTTDSQFEFSRSFNIEISKTNSNDFTEL